MPDKSPVALLLGHGRPFLVAMLATLKAGHFFVPLNPINPSAANRQILEDAGARLLLTDGRHGETAADCAAGHCPVVDLTRNGASQGIGGIAADSGTAAGDLAGLFYTSGTTGRPKGVMQSQRNFLHGTESFVRALGISASDRLLWGYHGSTCASVKNIFAGLLSGATLCPWDIGQEGTVAMAEWLSAERITVVYIFRSAFRQCMSTLAEERQFPDVRAVMLSSEPVFDSDLASCRARFPSAEILFNHLGSTEVGTYRRFAVDPAQPLAPGVLPLGHAVEDKEVLLWDENGAEVEPGEVGEIVVRSRYLALGYWRRPELNASLFSEPDGPGGPGGPRLFRSGDMGYLDGTGCLHSLGRKDDQVKIRGRRVQVSNVEAAISGLAGVQQAAVVARQGHEGEILLAAHYVASDEQVTGDRLRREMAARLPKSEVPAVFQRLDFPITLGGALRSGFGVVRDHQTQLLPGEFADNRRLSALAVLTVERGQCLLELAVAPPRHGQNKLQWRTARCRQCLQLSEVVDREQPSDGDRDHTANGKPCQVRLERCAQRRDFSDIAIKHLMVDRQPLGGLHDA